MARQTQRCTPGGFQSRAANLPRMPHKRLLRQPPGGCMTVLDPGHTYALGILDGDDAMILCFVKREGERYPGNVGVQCGTTLQEVLRACLDRIDYLDRQHSCEENGIVRFNL